MPPVRELKHRPRLLPPDRWARIALVLLVVFALVRGLLWASTQPAWLAPDEDYHWLYTEYLLINKTWPDLDEPFATQELYIAANATAQGEYYGGPRTHYSSDPRRSIRLLEKAPTNRAATGEPPRQVLHPPLYHLGAALVDRLVTNQVAPVRLTAIRYYSAALGALLVFLSWLLATQVLARHWQQLAVAAIVATQPMLAFSSATVSNDILTACAYTAVLAWCAWLLGTKPDVRQGYGLGLVLGVALLSKSTALVLLGVALLTVLLLWRTWPGLGRSVRGLALRAGAVTAVLAGWWYAVILIETGSPLGTEGAVASAAPHGPLIATAKVWFVNLDAAWDWIGSAYFSYWVFQFPYEVPPLDGWEIVPLIGAAAGIVGLVLFVLRARATLLDSARPALRQALVVASAPLGIVVPFFVVDMRRQDQGLPFLVATGRFSLAAYAAVATLFVLALCELAGRRQFIQYGIVGVAVAASLAYYVHTYAVWGLERYYAPLDGVLGRAIWDKPMWVTEEFLAALVVIGAIAFLGAVLAVVVGIRRTADQATHEVPSRHVVDTGQVSEVPAPGPS
jgi:Dolichyl-phosphate-mannose-protein mannosyltransferase